MSLRTRIRQWFWRRRPDFGTRYDRIVWVGSMSDVPDHTGADIYVVGHQRLPKWAVFDCPCLRGHQLRVPLMSAADPHWLLTVTGKKVTLSPSVSVDNDPCSSHFWLVANRVEWARWASEGD